MINVLKFLNDIKKTKILVILLLLFYCININTASFASSTFTENNPYEIITKRYERKPDKKIVIKFARLLSEKENIKNINYILEKKAFKLAMDFINPDLLKVAVLEALEKIYRQEIFVEYEILYYDKDLLAIEYKGEAYYYLDNDVFYMSQKSGDYSVFDLKTGQELKLSDFIILDSKIINYKAKNYRQVDYDSPAMLVYYSFKDAFQVYEDQKDEYHNEMSTKEAIEWLKEGNISWVIQKNKELLISKSWQSESSIKIPYSYIKLPV